MKTVKTPEKIINAKSELTAFVREVVLPGSAETVPKIDAQCCFFKLEYKRSPIHRWGIFALENIPARRRVIEYTGQKIDEREVFRRRIREHLYIFRLNKKSAIDGAIGGSGAEFINHSCQPNLYSQIRGGRVFYISRCRITAGEELTVDYTIKGSKDLPCLCGAESCRGIINRKV
jgi:SET domain-containing protein